MIDVFEPLDVFSSIERFKSTYGRCQCAILDPWYNKGFGGVREDYDDFIVALLNASSEIADHIYLWGFPEIVARFVTKIPPSHQFTAWLTWYYKNNPSVIRGWRSAQNTCLHLSLPGARLYPEHFLNEVQLQKLAEGKLRYMPGPPSVIESSLIIGFVGKAEQLGHPSQKPMDVYEKIVRMATKEGDLVFDPMCGSGTAGTVCRVLRRSAVLSDMNADYVAMTRTRLSGTNHDDILKAVLERQIRESVKGVQKMKKKPS